MNPYILSDSERLASLVQRELLRLGFPCPRDRVLALSESPSLATSDLDLVIVCLPPDSARALRVIGAMATKAKLLAVGPGTDPRLILQSLRAGADEFVIEEELERELGEVLQRLRGQESAPAGRTVAILGSSGGCGASTIAVNVAAALARTHDDSILIDLKLETGDLSALLDLEPKYTLVDLCREGDRLEGETVAQVLVPHASGVRLLASPRRNASLIRRVRSEHDQEKVTPEGVRRVLDWARASSPYVVVETSPTFREEQIEALRTADEVLLVVRLDFTSLRNARRALEHLEAIGVTRNRTRVIANRHDQPHALTPAQAEEALGVKLAHLVPDDPKTMNHATNVGVPAVLGSPYSRSARSLKQLADSLAAVQV